MTVLMMQAASYSKYVEITLEVELPGSGKQISNLRNLLSYSLKAYAKGVLPRDFEVHVHEGTFSFHWMYVGYLTMLQTSVWSRSSRVYWNSHPLHWPGRAPPSPFVL